MKRQWKGKERQWKGKERQWKGSGKAVSHLVRLGADRDLLHRQRERLEHSRVHRRAVQSRQRRAVRDESQRFVALDQGLSVGEEPFGVRAVRGLPLVQLGHTPGREQLLAHPAVALSGQQNVAIRMDCPPT